MLFSIVMGQPIYTFFKKFTLLTKFTSIYTQYCPFTLDLPICVTRSPEPHKYPSVTGVLREWMVY